MPPELGDKDGLVGVGGDLSPATLLRAYSDGVFPWFSDGDPILWWSPDPRGVLELDGLHVSRRLARTIRGGKFRVTANQCFERVMRACGETRPEGTWVTEEMVAAYTELHRRGHAHSLEVWVGDDLAGGIYGVAVGGLFAGESMFHAVTDASKVAIVATGGAAPRPRVRAVRRADADGAHRPDGRGGNPAGRLPAPPPGGG